MSNFFSQTALFACLQQAGVHKIGGGSQRPMDVLAPLKRVITDRGASDNIRFDKGLEFIPNLKPPLSLARTAPPYSKLI